MSNHYDYIDDFSSDIQADELREAQYWDEYREWMEGEELEPEPYDSDDDREEDDADYDDASYEDDGRWDDVPW